MCRKQGQGLALRMWRSGDHQLIIARVGRGVHVYKKLTHVSLEYFVGGDKNVSHLFPEHWINFWYIVGC